MEGWEAKMPVLSALLLFAAVTLQSPSTVRCERGGRTAGPARAVRRRLERPRAGAPEGYPASVDLYSLRARRRLAGLLRLRLLELRKADLERVSRALELRLEGPGGPAPPTLGR
jgi:hypothetical protein